MLSTLEDRMSEHKPRAYQLELYEHAKKQNSVLVLGTGSGKTFISILLIKELGHQACCFYVTFLHASNPFAALLQKSFYSSLSIWCSLYKCKSQSSTSSYSLIRSENENRKWTVFVVTTVPLVYQQGLAIQQHTPFNVGFYEGSRGVDGWGEKEWEEELKNHEVLVIVAQIFLDLLNSSYLSLENINLIIFDECHHATGNHPMREVMRTFNSRKEKESGATMPRIVGLTACAIHKNCKCENVENEIRELETTLQSTLVTSVDTQAVKEHTTAPKEIIVSFGASEPSDYGESIAAQLKGIECELDENEKISKRYLKPLKRKISNIVQIIYHLGDWFGARAVKYEMENFEEAEDSEEIPDVRDLKKTLCQRLELIYRYCLEQEKQMSNPLAHITLKVQRLLDMLCECRNDKYGLIFVERRNTAKLLYDFLKTLSLMNEDLAFIKPAYLIGANAGYSIDIKLIQNELRKQRETLEAFARGDTNFLISTSICEEGLDVRKCNIVIRFDEPMNFRSYVQSRGRARAIPSRYVLMTEDSNVEGLLGNIASYRKIEAALSKICHNRQLPTDMEISAHFAEDEIMAPYEPYGHDGPRITFNSAIQLINRYCGKLPQDKFAELMPSIGYDKKKEDGETMVKAKIQLPINSCLKTPVEGDWMTNRVHAKKSAAMALCIKLHQIKELNDHLRPEGKPDDSILDDLLEIPPEVSSRDGMNEPGTKKRRQIYRKEMCEAFSSMSGSFKLYSVTVQSSESTSSEIAIDSAAKSMSVGLLCQHALSSQPFPLYSSKWNEVVVRIQLIKDDLLLDCETVNQIKHFHKVVFETLLGINQSLFDYLPQQTGLFLLPMSGNSIDTSLLQHIASLDSLRMHEKSSHVDIFNFERSAFEDSVIYPLYKPVSETMFYVTEIHDNMNPLDPFPNTGKQFTSYEHYFLSEYKRKITNKNQPLVTAKHLPTDLNFLKQRTTKQSKKKSGSDPPKYVPELCGVLPIKASLWWQIMLLPSVLHRLNSLLVANDLKKMTFPYMQTSNKKSSECNILDFDWLRKFIKEIVRPPGSNLSVILAESTFKPIQTFMMLNALTLRGANDNFDAERLEVLGDSFLKFIVAEYLFLKFSDDHEGKLSERRSKLVCNRTLYTLGKAKQIPERIQSMSLNPALNGIMPGFVLKAEVEQKLRELGAPADMWTRFGETTEEEFEKEVRMKQEDGKGQTSCYKPWTEHELGDKSVADSVEALIGVCLVVGGSEAAIAFLHNLGIGVSKGTSLLKMKLPVKSAMLSDEREAKEEVQRYYKKSCLDKLEKKINYTFRDKSILVQAVTHSSYSQNRVTDCYQRLEFLGDAVLDYLVTGMIFTSDKSYNPGQLTDLRSYYVKNETLAQVSAKYKLHHHLLHLAPKLQASIDKYLSLFQAGLGKEEELFTEDDVEDGMDDLTDVDVPKALGDLVEALIGAVYLDSGRSLQQAWAVVTLLMDDIIKETLTDIPMNCIRKLYEKVPSGVQFVKLPMEEEEDAMAKYEVRIKGFPPFVVCGKNYKVAKTAAAKRGLWMLKKKEKELNTEGERKG
ncbi:endoribonuclease Dicer-like isoform X4 [Eriocheir sinensis]|uniref:endoribonuclease Dicer-like isoform X4 n=1 Tax=Eriocheir sinensis TaxID=95602 RepID=UPI0021CA97A6|nr:endoribonuclease Dicer-like isoform X4 [Eriocheir sinensis]